MYPLLESADIVGNVTYLTKFQGVPKDRAVAYVRANLDKISQKAKDDGKPVVTNDEILCKFQETGTVKDTAKALSVSRKRVGKVIKKSGMPPYCNRRQQKREARQRLAVGMRLRGMSDEQIGQAFGVSAKWAAQIIRQAEQEAQCP